MISVAANVVHCSTKQTVGAGWNKNSLLSTGLQKTSIGLYILRSPKFPSAAETSIPFNIHSDSANQSKSIVNDGTVNNHQFKLSWTHNGIRHSDPLHVPYTDIHQSNTPNRQVTKHNVRFRPKRISPPQLLSDQSLHLSRKASRL